MNAPPLVRSAEGDGSLAEQALAQVSVERIVADTRDLIAGMGENPGGTESDTVRRLVAICERIGASVLLQEIAPGRPNLLASLGPEDAPAILFLGHSDVVPAGEGWTADPFIARVRDGELVGRGAVDMKGGLAAVLEAMAAVAAVAPDIRVELLCTADEEDRAQGAQTWLAEHPERNYIACIVAEPTDLEIVVGCRGATNLHLEVLGGSAHAGRPEDGASAITAAARVIELVGKLHARAASGARDPLLGVPSWNVGTISGGSNTSTVPHSTQITIDRRTMPGEDPEVILAELLEDARADISTCGMGGAERIEVRGYVDMVMPGFRTSEDEAVIRVAARALTDLEGTVRITGWTAACEGGFIARHYGAPTIIFGAGDINTQAHQPDERVLVDHLGVAARAYVLIALGLAEEARQGASA